jgi:hypothetical protein
LQIVKISTPSSSLNLFIGVPPSNFLISFTF